MHNQGPTPGEKIVQLFLEDEGIKYKPEAKIEGLKGDTENYRIADFYLPTFKVYVEFLGKWNNPADRARYHDKKDVYKQNNIPCVYIYPDNLATLQYLFKWRLEEELKNHPKLKLQRLWFKKWKLQKFLTYILIYWTFSIVFFTVVENLYTKTLTIGLISSILITLVTIGMIIYGGYLILFQKDK